MSDAEGPVQAQVAAVGRIEEQLDQARKHAGRAIREAREAKHISLRTAAAKVRLSPGALSNLERGESWLTKTALRVARWVERADQAA